MTRRVMIAGVAVLLAVQSALVLDAAADQISIEQRSRLDAEIAGVPAELRAALTNFIGTGEGLGSGPISLSARIRRL
ncbi:MAG: hypothetical protein ACXWJ5_01730 [Xanthobacteraceae bacterium]